MAEPSECCASIVPCGCHRTPWWARLILSAVCLLGGHDFWLDGKCLRCDFEKSCARKGGR